MGLTTKKKFLLSLAISSILSIGSVLVFAQSPTGNSGTAPPSDRVDLQAQIQGKAQELDNITKQLESTRQNLQNTKQERLSLQQELSSLQGNINQLDLSMKVDEIAIQKLTLEMQSLSYDLQDIKSSALTKKEAVRELLRELQRKDVSGNSALIIFLKNKNLADGVLETQTLRNLQFQLAKDIENLRSLDAAYNKKVAEAGDKKSKSLLHQENLANKKLIIQDQKKERHDLIARTKNKESVYEQQVDELTRRQLEIAVEIEKVEAELRKNIDPNLLPIPRPGVLMIPVSTAIVTQGYGATKFADRNYKGKFHNGLDFGAPVGTEVFAAESGVVINVANQDRFCPRGAYGKLIVIKHKNGLSTLYGHLSRQIVTIGQAVERGQVIGYVGKTGWATGPHIHLTVFANNTLTPARGSYPEGTRSSMVCGPMPVGGDLEPTQYLDTSRLTYAK